jgi:transketolase
LSSTRIKKQSKPISATKAAEIGSSNAKKYGIDELKAITGELRRDVVEMTFTAGSGHPGGSLSEIETLTALYFKVMRHDPQDPTWPERDRFILSKGHACPGLYSVLARCGYFPHEELWTFRKINSRIQGHAHTDTPGVEMNSGSLGQGLSFAVGTALAANIDKKDYRMYVMLGDGECDEGQVWEAAMAASHYKLGNLTAFVDRNRIQNDRFTSEVMELEPLAAKWRAFGWRVLEIDGHDFGQILDSIVKAQRTRGRPTVIIARTVKGKGVSFMENNPDFHGRAPNQEEYDQAMRELA